MVDFFGNELHEGDTVVFSLNFNCEIGVAKIHHFGKKTIVLDVAYGYEKSLVPSSEKPTYRRCVSRYPDEVIKIFNEGNMTNEVAEVIHGKWIWDIEDKYQCTNCGKRTRVDEAMDKPLYSFCPYCGAKMDWVRR